MRVGHDAVAERVGDRRGDEAFAAWGDALEFLGAQRDQAVQCGLEVELARLGAELVACYAGRSPA